MHAACTAHWKGACTTPMPQTRGPRPTEICLTECQRAILEELVRRHQTPQVEVLRARIVLAAATGARNTHIAHTLGLDPKTVHLWRQRWAEAADRLRASAAEGGAQEVRQVICTLLADAPRSGCPATFTAEQLCQLMAPLACEAPEASGQPVTLGRRTSWPTKRASAASLRVLRPAPSGVF